MDNLSPEERGALMARVKGKDTGPEWVVRRLVHSMGFRYRLHRRDLPGRPDLVFGPRRKVIFVHGCFWHGHPDCKLARIPKSREAFWRSKIAGNRERDARKERALIDAGWGVMVVWECELGDLDTLKSRIASHLSIEVDCAT